MDAESRLGGEVVGARGGCEEAVLLAGRVAQPAEHGEDLLGVDDQAGLAAVVVGLEDGARVGVVQLLGDQLQARAHQAFGPPFASGSPAARAISRARSYSSIPPVGDRLVAGPLLGSVGVVAGAPARVGVAHDLALELVEPVHQRLGARRAARDVDVDRHELVGALDDRVVGEHPARRGAGAHRDHPLGLEHLVVQAADDGRHLDRDPAGEDQEVGLPRRGAHRLGAEAGDVVAGRDDRHHLDRAAGEPEGGREHRVGAAPVQDLLERVASTDSSTCASSSSPSRSPRSRSRARSWRTRSSSAERGCVEGGEAADLLPPHFQSSAPFLHT